VSYLAEEHMCGVRRAACLTIAEASRRQFQDYLSQPNCQVLVFNQRASVLMKSI
jgi:hypothetical protein